MEALALICRGYETKGFIVDEMLGKLARWLRILGFNTIWASELRETWNEDIDNRIIIKALREGLILVTRDKYLATKARKYGVKVILLRESDLISKIKKVLGESGVDLSYFPASIIPSRCPKCNGKLREVKKEDVYDKIPPKSRELYDRFWICDKCGKIYWKGSHWKKIEATINVLKIHNDKQKA